MVVHNSWLRRVILTLTFAWITACSGARPTPTPPPTTTPPPLPPLSGSGGGRIAFATNRDGNYEIYVMNADGSDKRRLTWTPHEDRCPVWSPDGTRIAWVSDHYGHEELWVMGADGTNEQRLTISGGAPGWSPDGSLIAYSRSAPGSDLYVMNADGTDLQRLTQTDAGIAVFSPAWSPDGHQIACAVDTGAGRAMTQQSTIRMLDLRDLPQGQFAGLSDLRELPGAGGDVNDRPAWSPDGSELLFTAAVDGRRGVYLVNADGTALRRLPTPDDVDAFGPDWSPDGARVAYQASPDMQWDIYIVNLDGSGLTRLTNHEGNDADPTWAP